MASIESPDARNVDVSPRPPDSSFSEVVSTDLDHYRAQPGNWNVQASKLGKGEFISHIRSLSLPGITVYDNRWGAASMIRGQSPGDLIMLGGIVTPDDAPVHWCGKEADRRVFACTGERQEIEFNLRPQAHDVVFLISPDLFEQALGPEALATVRGSRHLVFPHPAGDFLIDRALDMIRRAAQDPSLLESQAVVTLARSRLLHSLEACFEIRSPVDDLNPARREAAVQEALHHADQCITTTSALEMANAAGVSQRTLEHTFREVIGMTPGRYLKVARLNEAHHQLSEGSPGSTSVTTVATALGFTHPGRFSSAYMELFGELPSETLRR